MLREHWQHMLGAYLMGAGHALLVVALVMRRIKMRELFKSEEK